MSAPAPSEGLFSSLKNLMVTLVAIGKTRLALLSNEVEEEKLRLIRLLMLAISTLFLGGLGLVLLVAFATVAFWESRVLVLGLATVLVLGTALVVAFKLVATAKRGSTLFHASLAELESDLHALQQTAKPRADATETP